MNDKKVVIIPIKANSQGLPNKNRLLLRRCLNEILKSNYNVYVIGDDEEFLHVIEKEYNGRVNITCLPPIKPLTDVTDTIRLWRDIEGYDGIIALVQCTSPRIKSTWLDDCFKLYEDGKIVATVCSLDFKYTAIYVEKEFGYVQLADNGPYPSVARQLLPNAVRITGAIEVFNVECLDNESLFKDKILIPYFVSEDDSIDIDSKKDLEKLIEMGESV